MQIGFSIQYLNSYTRSAPVADSATRVAPIAAPADADLREQSRLTLQHVDRLNRALGKVDRLLRSPRAPVQSLEASVTSRSALGLDNTQTRARLGSTEQVNATTTSFTPFGPNFDGASNADVTIEGVYNGENGDDTLRFRVARGGTHGEDDLRIRVFDGDGTRIKTINIRASHDPDKTYNIGNGLKLSLGAGHLVKNDELFVEVSASTGASVDPDKAFNGVRNDQPNFEYRTNVSAGSFEVNGANIDVYANDSINSVLGRINSSAAGVTATFDVAAEHIVFTHDQAGSEPDIVLANDTSGFLAATKLATAEATPGKDADIDRFLANVEQLSAVTSGTFDINGIGIDIDTSLDTLNAIVARINAKTDGITATLVEDGQRLRLEADEAGLDIVLDDADTGFFQAIGIEPGQYGADPGNSSFSPTRASSLADAVGQAVGAINDLTNDARIPGSADGELAALRSALQSATTGESSDPAQDVGLGFSSDKFGGDVGNAVHFDRGQLRRLAVDQPHRLDSFFLGGDGSGGLLKRLANAMSGYVNAHADQFGAVGSLLDVFV